MHLIDVLFINIKIDQKIYRFKHQIKMEDMIEIERVKCLVMKTKEREKFVLDKPNREMAVYNVIQTHITEQLIATCIGKAKADGENSCVICSGNCDCDINVKYIVETFNPEKKNTIRKTLLNMLPEGYDVRVEYRCYAFLSTASYEIHITWPHSIWSKLGWK